MGSKAAWLLAGIVAMTVPTLAQSVATDTLSQLLAEVRQLRIAMERAATTTPQIQLLGMRLNVQNERLSRADGEHNASKQELDEISATLAQVVARTQDLETHGPLEADAEKQRVMELAATRQQVADLTAREQRLRAREAELAGALGVEQTQWTDLIRRIDEVERSLAPMPPR
jgi:hypothetical protein